MSDYLIHYGVKGMKWGVRKQRPTSGYSRLHRAYKAQMRDAAGLRKHGYTEEANAVEKRKIEKKEAKRSSGGMSNGKKAAIAAGVGIAVAGTVLAVYGKKKYGSLNPKKMKAAKEIADRISGRSNDKALKSIKKEYKFTPRNKVATYKTHPAIKSNAYGKRMARLGVYDNANSARLARYHYNRYNDDDYLKIMNDYGNKWGSTKTVRVTTPRRSKRRSINTYI